MCKYALATTANFEETGMHIGDSPEKSPEGSAHEEDLRADGHVGEADSGQEQVETRPNARPEEVKSLLYEGDVFSGWPVANRNMSRFYVVNLERVMGRLGVAYNAMPHFLRLAEREIDDNTDWKNQYRFDYECSHVQLKPDKRFKSKLFDRAVTIIVAMEMKAQEVDPDFNVYDFMRIIPATYFIEGFRREQLAALEGHYHDLGVDERKAIFGTDTAPDFEQAAISFLDQREGQRLLQQMVSGHTATLWVCDRLRELVATHFPQELHLGPTLQAGHELTKDPEEGQCKLGVKKAADALVVPRRPKKTPLPSCY